MKMSPEEFNSKFGQAKISVNLKIRQWKLLSLRMRKKNIDEKQIESKNLCDAMK